MVGWGSYAGDNGSEGDLRLVHFWEAVDPGWLAAGRSELMVQSGWDVTTLLQALELEAKLALPIDKAVQVIQHRLTQDDTLAARTTLPPDQVIELLDMCLRSTYFSHGGGFFEQQEGATMGSPVSAAVVNLYMEFFEGLAFTQAPDECRPRIWKRYVDETFCILRKGTVEKLLNHLKSLRPTIQFTVEVERDGSLLFMDILLRRKDDGSLDGMVCRKPTHTD